MRALEVAAPEKDRILTAVQGRSGGPANPIANLIARNSAEHDRKQKPLKRDNACGREDAGSDQQRITWKKKANKKAGFDEDDGAN